MVSARKPSGDIPDQIGALGVLFNLAIVENPGIAIAYDVAIRKQIAALSRLRRSGVGFAHLLPYESDQIK